MTVFATEKLRLQRTHGNFRKIQINGMLGKEMGYEISSCQMQYDAITRKQIEKIHASYTLEGTVLENVWSIKYLGVTITNDLRWNTYASNICTKANRTLGFLRRNLYACPQEVKGAAYKGLVHPVLEYSGSVWDPSGVGLQNELEKVQTRAARFVTGNYNFEIENVTGILEHLKWESLKKWRRDSRLILLYKSLKGKASILTDDLIPLVRAAGMIILWHIRSQLLTLIFISVAEDGIAKFTSLVRARD